MTQDASGQDTLQTDGSQRKPWQAPTITDARVNWDTTKSTQTGPENYAPIYKVGS
jgi:hypothetical protein